MAKKKATRGKEIKESKKKVIEVEASDLDDLDIDTPPEEIEEDETEEKPTKKNKEKKGKKEKVESSFDLDDIKSELKDFSKDLEFFTDDETNIEELETKDIPYFIPFSNEALQFITGGVCGGKVIEISGDSQSGKSFLAYQIMASVHEMGGWALLNDIERASTLSMLSNCGVKIGSRFNRSYERDLTKMFGLYLFWLKGIRKKEKELKMTPKPAVIVMDSFAMAQIKISMDEYEKGKDIKGYAAMQKNAKYSDLISKFTGDLDDLQGTLVVINQTTIDYNITFGDKVKSKGEEVNKFPTTQRIRGKHLKKLTKTVPSLENPKEGNKIQVGVKVQWTCIKNRFVAPFQKAITYILFDRGMDKYKGFAENLIACERIKLVEVPVKKKDGTDGKKTETKFMHVESGGLFNTVKEILEAHPEVRTPIKVGEVSDDGFEEEDDEAEDSEDKE